MKLELRSRSIFHRTGQVVGGFLSDKSFWTHNLVLA